MINQSIPEEDFVVDLPVGTRIQRCAQPGEVLRFELDEPSSSSVLLSVAPGSESEDHPVDSWTAGETRL